MFCVELAWLEKDHCATENQTNAEWGLTAGESKHRMVCLHFEITLKNSFLTFAKTGMAAQC